MGDRHQEDDLERTLGFTEAFTIGAGTMIGAGIFLFPGLAGGRAGMAASLSFAIGAVIAVLVALCVSELATAIPRSGGTYYFVNEGVGRAAGAIVGLSLWLGLIFASAFYLVGFGIYLEEIVARLGFEIAIHPPAVGIVSALGLTLVNVLGTEKAGELEDYLVFVLLAIMLVVLGYGLIDITGTVGAPRRPDEFAPSGVFPIFTTAALVFTSYLGFAGIANLAGEIREPDRNLPRSMIGSVVLVGILYVVTIVVATSVFGSERLAELGETATVELGLELLGPVGALVVLGAGFLATASSANASLMAASRSVYALSDDKVLPDALSRVNESFGTPHISILATGIPIAVAIGLGYLELLAEVASVLHLVLYGMMCAAVFLLRRRNPDWYEPGFELPGHPFVPLLGAAASFSLILFMQLNSKLVAAALLAVASVWYVVHRNWRRFHE
jgi:amino acid transporter